MPQPQPPAALPERHGGTGFAVLGREPTVAFATWDLPLGAGAGWTVAFRCEGAGGVARAFQFPAEAHSAYLQGLVPGGRYEVRATLRSPEGAVRTLVPAVAGLALPPEAPGEGKVLFARAPWVPGAVAAPPVPASAAPLRPSSGPLPTSAGGPGHSPGATPSALPPGSPGLPSGAGFRMGTSPGAR